MEHIKLRVICPGSGNIRHIPVAVFPDSYFVENTCNFSNGTYPCQSCISIIHKRLNEDPELIRKSYELPISLF